jgi:hypothetical protein
MGDARYLWTTALFVPLINLAQQDHQIWPWRSGRSALTFTQKLQRRDLDLLHYAGSEEMRANSEGLRPAFARQGGARATKVERRAS